MLKLKQLLAVCSVLLWTIAAKAQSSDIDMADGLRASGKIYVVVAVLSIIFLGIIAFLIRIDGKVTALEAEVKDKK